MRQHWLALTFAISVLIISLSGCYSLRRSSGGGQTQVNTDRKINALDVALPKGYELVPVSTGLTFPTGITFDDSGNVYVTEAGYSYGEKWLTPRLQKIKGDKKIEIASGDSNGPWNGVYYKNDFFYVAEGGQRYGGRILKIDLHGNITILKDNLPGQGDHHTNGPVIGPDNRIYFGQGTATNSGIVGLDNFKFGWLKRNPDFHDIPCESIAVFGSNFASDNPLTPDSSDQVITGPYQPFGTGTSEGQMIPGKIPCSGAVFSMSLQGEDLRLAAWGFRNPFGMAFSSKGQLYITENGFDDRGSRPVWGAGDYLWKVENGLWYGWPDYTGGEPVFQKEYAVPGKAPPKRLIMRDDPIPKPVAIFGVHTSSNGMDFSKSQDFGYWGEAFVAQFGDMAPGVGKTLAPVGYKIVRVNTETGIVDDFAVNKGNVNGPASKLRKGGLERPVAVRFTNDGKELYIVDFGIMGTSETGEFPMPGTGVIWKIRRIK